MEAGKIPAPAQNQAAQSQAALPPHDGKQAQPQPVQDTAQDRQAKYQQLINGEFKDLFSEHVQKIINDRFKQTKTLEEQVAKYKAIAERVATKYGANADDPDSVLKSVDEDDSYFEEEAMRRGLTVEQLKDVKRLERENAELMRIAQSVEAKKAENERNSRWYKESEELKKQVPNFDLFTELQNPETGKQFLELISNPYISVKAAYNAIHLDDILGGAMAYTAQQVQQKTVNDIMARGMRPVENGVSGHAPAQIMPKSAKELTKEDHKRINKLLARGEDFTFGK